MFCFIITNHHLKSLQLQRSPNTPIRTPLSSKQVWGHVFCVHLLKWQAGWPLPRSKRTSASSPKKSQKSQGLRGEKLPVSGDFSIQNVHPLWKNKYLLMQMSNTSFDSQRALASQISPHLFSHTHAHTYIYIYIFICLFMHLCIYSMKNNYIGYVYTSSTAQSGGGSFKTRKPIGEIGCCESGMAERIHWWTERCLRSPLFLPLSLTIYPPTNLSSMYPSIYRSIYPSLSLFHLITYLSIYLI